MVQESPFFQLYRQISNKKVVYLYPPFFEGLINHNEAQLSLQKATKKGPFSIIYFWLDLYTPVGSQDLDL